MAGSEPWTTHPQSEQDLILDGPALRALSHPVRVQILDLLRQHGPSTASRLAGQLGLNSGATSYHLRQLASADLVAEDAALGNNRDRWWRAAVRSTYFDPAAVQADPEAAMAYLNVIARSYAERLVEFGYRLPDLPGNWSGSATMSDCRLLLTAPEAAQMISEISTVIAQYRRADDAGDGTACPAGAKEVHVQVHVMPQLTEPAP